MHRGCREAAFLASAALGASLWIAYPGSVRAQTFNLGCMFGIASSGRSVALSDVDADGDLDLVFANSASHNVGVSLGDGMGGFVTPTYFATGTSPWAMAVADVNGDSKLDLAVAASGDHTVSVLLGDGLGGFGPKVDFPTGSTPYAVQISDLDGDTKLDLVVANSGDNTVSVLLGDGDGSFGTKTDYPAGSAPNSVAVADLSGDGVRDLAVANSGSGTVSVLLGDGNGEFGPKTDHTVGNSPSFAAIEDVDGDNDLDLAVANFSDNTCSILLGNGNGTFGPKTDFTVVGTPRWVAIEDLSLDGKPDLVAVTSHGASVRLGDGAGGFAPVINYGDESASPWFGAIGDLNRDSRPDLAYVSGVGSRISLLLGNGPGLFEAAPGFEAGNGVFSIEVADLNDDDNLDVATANFADHTVSVLLGTGAGTFAPKTDFPTGAGPVRVRCHDVSGDGKLDLVTANYFGSTASVLLGDGSGSFAPHVEFPVGSAPHDVAVAHLNADAAPDLILANSDAATISVLLGDGVGTFGPKTDLAVGTTPRALAIADLNGDTKVDLAVANETSHTASVFLGNGTGGFGPRTDFNAPISVIDVEFADLTNDGNLDLVGSCGNNTLSVWPGNGLGGFGARLQFNSRFGATTASLAIADIGLDGRLDVVAGNTNSHAITFFLDNGTCGLRSQSFAVTATSAPNPTLADVNRDGVLDILVPTTNLAEPPTTVEVFLGVKVAPRVVVGPTNQAVCVNDDVHLAVQAAGVGLAYQWRKNGANLVDGGAVSGATSAALTLSAVFPNDSGSYDVVLSSPFGLATSDPAVVSVCEKPVFTAIPQSRTDFISSTSNFNVTLAAACDAPQIQWFRDGVALVEDGRVTGVTTPNLSISPVQAGDAGYYDALVANGCGSQSSPQAFLSVTPCPGPPSIQQQPADVFVPNGTQATFDIAATGCVSPTYQWLKGNVAIPGATSNTYTIASVTPADAGFFRVAVTAGGLSTLSAVAALNIAGPIFVNVSHRYVGSCSQDVQLTWQTNVVADFEIEYEFSTGGCPGTNVQTAVAGPATGGILTLTPQVGMRFLCYRITATDEAKRTAATPNRLVTLPIVAFDMNRIRPSIITSSVPARLITPGDAVRVGVSVANDNCSALTARVLVDQAQLKNAPPRNAAGAITLPVVVANAIAANSVARLPNDLMFLRSQIGGAPGSNATFSGRLKIETPTPVLRYFSGSVRLP